MTGHGRRLGAASTFEIARFVAVAAGSVGVGIAAHVLSGGPVPTSCVTVLALLALASLITGVATLIAHRTRGPWAALAALGFGQAAMTIALAVPSADHIATWTLHSAVMHAVGTAGLGAVLLGGERVLAGLSDLIGAIAPALRGEPAPPIPARGAIEHPGPAPVSSVVWLSARSLRGPPTRN